MKRYPVIVILAIFTMALGACHGAKEVGVEGNASTFQWGDASEVPSSDGSDIGGNESGDGSGSTSTSSGTDAKEYTVLKSIKNEVYKSGTHKGTIEIAIEYDASGRVLTLTRKDTDITTPPSNPVVSKSLMHYENDLLHDTTVTKYGTPVVNVTYEYSRDSDGRLIKQSTYENMAFYGSEDYTYSLDAATNILTIEYTKKDASSNPVAHYQSENNAKKLPISGRSKKEGEPDWSFENMWTYTPDGMMETITRERYDVSVSPRKLRESRVSTYEYNGGKPYRITLIDRDELNSSERYRKEYKDPVFDGNLLKEETVWESTDGGATWNKAEVRTFEYETIPVEPKRFPATTILSPVTRGTTLFDSDKPESWFKRPTD